MHKRRLVWSVVFTSYIAASLTARVLWTGHGGVTAESIAQAVVVPGSQIIALELLNWIGRLRL